MVLERSSGQPYRATPDARREGALLRVRALSPSLPPRCVLCNAPEATRVKRTLHRISRPDSTLMFVAVVVVSWWALFWLAPVFVEFGLCAEHARARRRDHALTLGGAVAAFAIALGLGAIGSGWATLAIAASLVLWRVASWRQEILRIAKRDGAEVLLVVPAPFLASFPDRG